MIESVKSYFKSIVNDVDSDLTYDGLVFENDLTADHNLDYTYKLVIGTMAINRVDTSIQSEVPVTITIYKISNIDNLETDFSNIYCKAIDITARAMNQTLVDQAAYIKSVVAQSINPAPILNNDNGLQFTLEFNVTIAYDYKL